MFIVEQSLVLPRSAAEVSEFLSEPRNDPRWRSDIRRVRVLTNGPLRVGTRNPNGSVSLAASGPSTKYPCLIRPIVKN